MASEYSKMPVWKMVLLYLVIGGLVYYLIYYFVFAKKGGYNYTDSYQKDSPSTTQEVPRY